MLLRAVYCVLSVSGAIFAQQTITLSASPAETAFGQAVTLIATAPNVPPGSRVTFTDQGVLLSTVAVTGGQAVLTVRLPRPGFRKIRASLSGMTAEAVVRITPGPTASFAKREDLGGAFWHDLNGDGLLDKLMLVSNWGIRPRASVELNIGNGTFGPAQPVPPTHPWELFTLGDFNNDGKRDVLLYTHPLQSFELLQGRGDGTFDAKVKLSVTAALGHSEYLSTLVSADLDSDGRDDLVLGGAAGIEIVLQTATGTFQLASRVEPSRLLHSGGILVGDVNGDGRLDVMTARFSDDSCGVAVSSGSTWIAGPEIPLCGAVELADFNNDGRADLLSPGDQTWVALRLAQPDGSFPPLQSAVLIEPKTNPPANYSYFPAGVADWNADGNLDIIQGARLSGLIGYDIRVRLGLGDGSFSPVPIDIPLNDVSNFGYPVRTVDLNGDSFRIFSRDRC